MVASSPATNGDDDLSRPSRIASTGPISLGSLLGSIQHEWLEGEPPLEFAVARAPWGTLAFRPGDVMAIAAPPGMGKSALISQLLDDAQRLNPLAISLTVNVEMTVQTMVERKISRLCGVPLADIARRNRVRYQASHIQPGITTLESIGDRVFFMDSPFTLDRIVEASRAKYPRDRLSAANRVLRWGDRYANPAEHVDARGQTDCQCRDLRCAGVGRRSHPVQEGGRLQRERNWHGQFSGKQ